MTFKNLNEACDEVRHLREYGYQLAGTWSLAQILDHLNRSMQMTVDGADFTFPAILRPIFRLLMMPTLRKGKPSKLRGKAPQPLIPDPHADEETVAKRFYELAERLMHPDTEFAASYPMLGRLSREEWLLLQRWHIAHHLSFVVPEVSRTTTTSKH
ncbi:DUF1569 domain-containing protein [Rhodopirellula europaea]|uniref:Protein containing DUF1569 n=1 Tax=Rhodopirellula europaea 6C TaxID=1263867 RepID=M2B2W1_9BACT|nr:DUF1569 domain-containing protein [Rhodopirellula europaea]EMB16534.1 protein containing DUF1569 [Rhodopirellula europaea 6C]